MFTQKEEKRKNDRCYSENIKRINSIWKNTQYHRGANYWQTYDIKLKKEVKIVTTYITSQTECLVVIRGMFFLEPVDPRFTRKPSVLGQSTWCLILASSQSRVWDKGLHISSLSSYLTWGRGHAGQPELKGRKERSSKLIKLNTDFRIFSGILWNVS